MVASSLSIALWSARADALQPMAPGAVSAQTLKLPDGPASVRGLADDPSVAVFSAQVGYSIPIQLPAAAHGFAPSMALAYSGALGNGPLGVGWALATPTIRRSDRLGVPTFTASDDLELLGVGAGGRLVAAGDGTWRIEGRGNAQRVRASGDGFVLDVGDGTRITFGTTAAARKQSGARVAEWYAESIEDSAGQKVALAYEARAGQVYLSSMAWGPAQTFEARVVYEDRPDAITSHRAGFPVTTARRVRAIEVRAAGEVLRTYTLAYDATWPLSRLVSVSLTGRGGQGQWPTTTFEYASPAPATAQKLANTGGWQLNDRGVSFLDVDGDGMSDLAHMEVGAHSFRKNLGGGAFADPAPITGAESVGLSDLRLLDLDGDARPEMITVVGDTWRWLKLGGTKWTYKGIWKGTAQVPTGDGASVLADVNGDGRTDVVVAGTNGVGVYFGGASGLGAVTPRPPISATNAIAPGDPSLRWVDLNGDGLVDVAWLTDQGIAAFVGHGDGTFEPLPPARWPWPASSIDLPSTFLTDLNRDGLIDVVRFGAGTMEWYRGRPGIAFDAAPIVVARPAGADADAVVAIADVDGNGSDDVVWSSSGSMWALDVAGATSAGMLSAIHNGLGETVSFEYAASATLSAADEAAGKGWRSKLPISIPVPVTMTVRTGGADPDRVVRFGVRDGFWDGVERRFGGFLFGSERHGDAIAATIETTYEPGLGARRVLRGEPLVSTTRDDRGNAVLVHTFVRDTVASPGLDGSPLLRRGVLVSETVEHDEGLASPVLTRTDYTFDAEGRVTEERRLGRVDVTGDESTSFTTWGSDDATWVRDVVVTRGTKDASGAVVRSSRRTYGDDQTILPLGQVGRGWLRKTESLLVDAARGEVWRDDEELRYDALGNVVASFDGTAWRTRVYDPSGLFVQEEDVVSAGRTIAWRATWDPVLSAPTSITGPNGETTYVAYDPLGRLASRAHQPGLPFLIYEYDWTAPRPRTVVRLFEGDESTLAPFTAWAPGSGWRESASFSNGRGEPLYTTTRLGSGQVIVEHWTTRDDRGRVVFEGEPFEFDGAADAVVAPAGLAGATTTYDALGRTVDRVLATGGKRHSTYDAFSVTTATDGLAPVTTRLDGLGRVVHTERVVGGVTEAVDATYDAAGEVTALALQGGLVRHAYAYDTLGRLVGTRDPDSGARTLRYDDADHLVEQINGAGESVRYDYDDLGRVVRTTGADGRAFTYHYDVEKDGTSTGRTLGRVAWVEEPRGEAHFAYDLEGRVARARRTVNGRALETRRTFAPMGALLGVTYDDGFGYDVAYDDAGRVMRVGDLWQALTLDARGAVVSERMGNGVTETYERDALGQPSRLRIARPSGSALYDVVVQRNAYGAITSAQDGDGVGLDHTATYGYDAAGRLTQATLGGASSSFQLAYAYDGLQNLVSRAVSGPKALGVVDGTYVYGEAGRSPRQVTRVTSARGDTTLDYDAAGRVIREGGTTLAYDAFDELVKVSSGTGGGVAAYDYGYDGERTWTRAPDGGEQIWLDPDVTEKGGVREHTVVIAGRAIAKVTSPIASLPTPASGALERDRDGASGSARAAMAALLVALATFVGLSARRSRARLAPSFAAMGLVALVAACSSSGGAGDRVASEARAWSATSRVYFHQGFAAGPVLFTRADGTVEEERRYEPFGQAIDAYRESAGASTVGDVDYGVEARNALNVDADPSTGWSYHGARWMAPQLARWLTPDPPTKGPDAKFLVAPWDLNPYAYVRGNPLVYWDPDGQDWKSFAKGFIKGAVVGAVTAAGIAVVAAVAPAAATVIGVGLAAKGAYDLYKGRHEIAALAHRVASGTTTDADHEVLGNVLGGIVGGGIGAKIGTKIGSVLKPSPAKLPEPAVEPAPRCSGGSCGCFVAGTLVATLAGPTPIEQVRAGDLVLSRDAETGETAFRRVEEAYVREVAAIEEIDFAGDDGETAHVSTTFEHPFRVDGRGWTYAVDLQVGDHVLTAEGAPVTVVALRAREGGTVYNFRVEGFHSYFVTGSAIWVHNANCPVDKIWTSKGNKTSVENAYGHWEKHGGEFPEYNNALEYAKGAKEFTNSPPKGALSKVRANGDTVVYDPASNTFGVRTSNGTPRTLFRPDPAEHGYPTNLDYFNAQH